MLEGHSYDRTSRRGAFLTLTACSAAMLLLSACESTGGTRFSSVGAGTPGSGAGGSAGGGGTGSSGGGSGTDGGADTGTGGAGTGGGTGTGGAGSGGSGSGSGSTGSGGTLGAALQQVSPVLVTAGNAVLGVSDGQGSVTTPIATAVPLLQPVTGTITRVLDDTGTVLVDAGQGRTLLLQGAQGVVGDLVSIDVGGQTVIQGLDGTPGAIGAGVLGSTQPVGTVASVSALNAGNTVLASVNGIADVQVTNVSAPTGGIATNLLDVALGGNQLIGTGSPAAIQANVLPGGLPTTGAGGTGGLLAPVESVVNGVTSTTSGLTSSAQQVGGEALAPIGVAAGATAGGTSAGAGATASPGGVLTPVTGTVSGTLNSLTGGLGLTNP
ncbi:hypothetical protein [Sphingobium sp. EP60837]|uniref:hypothetical protein n=1 Tax=Sphingobium sp. EP60837 TaxID=1855519 RepID=UPI0007DCD385|nr:hypothetical protein [Sphingobium sp. EP60837]ANI79537.1 Keratin, type I cytoskeletal [Sphingobium sp. EP60837]